MQPNESIVQININDLMPNRYQPRKMFDENALNDLSKSIQEYGILNPILVKKNGDKYEIIAGERRYRAAKKIGMTTIPAIVKNIEEQQLAELALIENLHRENLNSIEEAKSYEDILKINNQTQQTLAEKLGKSQSAIANKIRLLSLPVEIQNALANRQISERHARSIMTIKEPDKQLAILEKIIKEKLTVKETETIIKQKDISQDEVKKAINDILNSLNDLDYEEEEKGENNMNNGNFFPSYDNNIANQNPTTSLNTMNMQSMAQPTVQPQEQENVMPTVPTAMPSVPVQEIPPQPIQEMPQQPVQLDAPLFGPSPVGEQTMPAIDPISTPLFNMPIVAETPSVEQPIAEQNVVAQPIPSPIEQPVVQPIIQPAEQSTFGPELVAPTTSAPASLPTISATSAESMPTLEAIPQTQPVIEMPPVTESAIPSFEVPVTTPETGITPTFEATPTPTVDKLTLAQQLLTNNQIPFKLYSNETGNCIIIEL